MENFLQLLRTQLRIEEPVDSDTPLISSGLIDSFDVVTLLTFVESEYRVAINPEDIDVDTFDTPAQMLAYIDAAMA
jgi:acyl carrier protein